jgi:DNA-binding NtrC family response regulator
MGRQCILIADDEPTIRFTLGAYLGDRGYDIEEASTCAETVARFRSGRIDAAVLDHAMPDGYSVDMIALLRQLEPDAPLVILTGHGTIELAVRAIQQGADQFITKPVELPALAAMVERLLDKRRALQRDTAGQRREARATADPFLGTSPAIRALAEEARRIAAADSPVLIQGETGAGKGVLAAWLHASGPRACETFVDLSCAGLAKEFLETELFGHERGAFTSAVSAKQGLLEIAHRGSLFLDEVGDMDLQVQAKLLKVIEDQRFRRLGDVRDRQVDVRLIAATHLDLKSQVARNAFRADLYFRISTLPLRVPALRERREDIETLARRLLQRIGQELGRGAFDLEPDALAALREWDWPGNVRELRNVLERAALLSDQPLLSRRSLRFESLLPATASAALSGTLEQIERRAIEQALEETGGNVSDAARRLGLSRSTLYAKVRSFGLTTGG